MNSDVYRLVVLMKLLLTVLLTMVLMKGYDSVVLD